MLRDRQKNLRIEELPVPEAFVGRPISALNLKRFPHALLLAVKVRDDWAYNPPENHVINREDTLVFMTTPEGRDELAGYLKE
jgi:voltage-gated potassium channel